MGILQHRINKIVCLLLNLPNPGLNRLPVPHEISLKMHQKAAKILLVPASAPTPARTSRSPASASPARCIQSEQKV